MACQSAPSRNVMCFRSVPQRFPRSFGKILRPPSTLGASDVAKKYQTSRRLRSFLKHTMPSIFSKQLSGVAGVSQKNSTLNAETSARTSTHRGANRDTKVAHAGNKGHILPTTQPAAESRQNMPQIPSISRDQILISTAESSEEELAVAALLAHLSNLAYYSNPSEQLRALGLRLVATGETAFTSFYIADGPDPSSSNHFRPTNVSDEATSTGVHVDGTSSPPHASENGERMREPTMMPMKTMTRFVIARGVAWSRPSVDSQLLWRQLSKFWPTAVQIPPPGSGPNSDRRRGSEVVAHAGIKEIADEIYDLVAPHLAAVDLSRKRISTVRFGGHSMGGSVALLLLTRLQNDEGLRAVSKTPTKPPRACTDATWQGDPSVSVHTFGSPPVLASGEVQQRDDTWTNPLWSKWTAWAGNQPDGTGGTSKMLPPVIIPVLPTDPPPPFSLESANGSLPPKNQVPPRLTTPQPTPATPPPTCGIQRALGLPPGSMQAYVLDQDIVARAGLAADPLYGMALKIGWVKAAMEFRERVLGGGGVLTADRFLFQTAGEVHFMHSKGSRVMVRRLDQSQANIVLKMDAAELLSKPVSLVKTVTDHSHKAYADGLRLALEHKRREKAEQGS